MIPALLSWLGLRADRGRIPFLGRGRAAARPSRLWAALVRRVVSHPAIWGVTAAVALLALAAPALGMRLGQATAVDAPPGQAVVRTMSEIHRAFRQAPAPAEVVVTGPDATGPRVMAAVAALQGRATTGGPIREPVTAVGSGTEGLALLIPLAGHGTDTRCRTRALAALRGQSCRPRCLALWRRVPRCRGRRLFAAGGHGEGGDAAGQGNGMAGSGPPAGKRQAGSR